MYCLLCTAYDVPKVELLEDRAEAAGLANVRCGGRAVLLSYYLLPLTILLLLPGAWWEGLRTVLLSTILLSTTTYYPTSVARGVVGRIEDDLTFYYLTIYYRLLSYFCCQGCGGSDRGRSYFVLSNYLLPLTILLLLPGVWWEGSRTVAWSATRWWRCMRAARQATLQSGRRAAHTTNH